MRLYASDDPRAVRAAADALRRGELVIFPTETVYGLAADARNDSAVRAVFELKGREETSALPVQIAEVESLHSVACVIPNAALELARRFWPGPLTIVLPKAPDIGDLVTGGAATVGVRIPDHPTALALLREMGSPIVATSANISGRPAPTNACGAIRQLGSGVSVVIDAGECAIGAASTVVDLSASPPRILRRGSISARRIRELIGEVENGGD